jgi:hypothetical protein
MGQNIILIYQLLINNVQFLLALDLIKKIINFYNFSNFKM